MTNTFPYSSISSVAIDEKNPDQICLDFDKKQFVYKTAHRGQLMCQLLECITKKVPRKLQVFGPFDGQRLRKNGTYAECRLLVSAYGIVEQDPVENVLQEYSWVNFKNFGSDEKDRTLYFEYSGRTKIFMTSSLDRVVSACKSQLKQIGLSDKVAYISNQALPTVIKKRLDLYGSVPAAVSVYDVNKFTKRSLRPMPRQLHISEDYILEMDSSGFQHISFRKIINIYAIVRSWDSLREFTIEYDDGSSRKYSSSQRDTILAMLLDVCHAAGNARVIVTGEISDGLRLMPRFAEEEYQKSITDAFFGSSSIEAWYVNRLAKACKAQTLELETIAQSCRELNANIPCPGISPDSDVTTVKICLSGVLRTVQNELVRAYRDERLDNSRILVVLLQTIYRLLPCVAGYKGFVEVKEVDTRQLLLQLLKYNHDFVNYWTLEVMKMLCCCPLEPRNMQQEFVNKHTILTDRMLKYLLELMIYRTDNVDDYEKAAAELEAGSDAAPAGESTESSSKVEESAKSVSEESAASSQRTKGSVKQPVAANPTTFAHIPTQSFKSKEVVKKEDTVLATGCDAVHFTPNSLLVVGAATLFESLISSRRDSSSPELLNQILDMLANRIEVLISMLRSTSFLIMENAAIIMFTLLRNRPHVAALLRELALSECLVLKHFYNAVFSPSGTQRFISRFLVATWITGSPKVNPGKGLLTRMIPSGLVEYLKHSAISEEHRKNLDLMEEEFYATFANASGKLIVGNGPGGRQRPVIKEKENGLQARMRRRIAAALKEPAVEKVSMINQPVSRASAPPGGLAPVPVAPGPATTGEANATGPGGAPNQGLSNPGVPGGTTTAAPNSAQASGPGVTPAPAPMPAPVPPVVPGPQLAVVPPSAAVNMAANKTPENYRIMFHVMTQDHKLPDLIWNEQTRLELRNALEMEIKEYEREQRLLGSKKIAWNYQQYSIRYDSLRDEMQVGPIYVRYFLEAGDAFLRSLENPSHIILFEKLFRRIMVNIEYQPNVAILCTRCLVRLYQVCYDIIGGFDDMMILVRMLEQANNLELQQCLLDLLVLLSTADDSNLTQLLDKNFVNNMVRYVSLAHINPDQIGNVLARATNNVLMIKDAYPSDNAGDAPEQAPGVANDEKSEEEISKALKRSLWVPDDVACPKEWFAAPPTKTLPPPKQSQKGPYRVSELLLEFERGNIGNDWLVAPVSAEESDDIKFVSIVDTGRWKTIEEIFQLRLQMLFPGKAIYSPAQVSSKVLQLLQRLAALHRSANSKGIPFYPIPLSKRIMSDPSHLNIFAQLLLSNDPSVVDNAAELIRSLVEFNHHANSKLYLTGLFFFAARYTGNNYDSIAHLFSITHLKQSFHDSAASIAREVPLSVRSVLGSLFPAAMISILHNYGPERFASIQSGDFDTPEVIWNATLRKHLVEMVNQHLGDYPQRLRQFTLLNYEYIPLAKIHYPKLEKELYVHEYYLRNLCNEVKFPEWPVAEPLLLLRETIERWRAELAKGDMSDSAGTSGGAGGGLNAIMEAKKLLQLPNTYENSDLRKAYKNLARQYHPDKNPNGREMFEKIHVAYELLASLEDAAGPGAGGSGGGPSAHTIDMKHIFYLLKTQNLLYRRFPLDIADQKYPAYRMLIQVLVIPSKGTLPPGLTTSSMFTGDEGIGASTSNASNSSSGNSQEKEDGILGEVLVQGTMLMYYTTQVSPLNAREFVKTGLLEKLVELISYAVSLKDLAIANAASTAGQSGHGVGQAQGAVFHVFKELLTFAMKTLTAIVSIEEGRQELLKYTPIIAHEIYVILGLKQVVPLAVENAIEVVARACSLDAFQQQFMEAGIIWQLIPLLLEFDQTYTGNYDDESQRQAFNQCSSNMLAIISAKALGRLGGYMFDELKTTSNPYIKGGLGKLLTSPLATLLRNRRPWDLLGALNENIEATTKIWNVGMRKELLEFVNKFLQRRPLYTSNPDDLADANNFVFSNLREELCIGSVYIRVFNKTGDTKDIDDPSRFACEMIEYLLELISKHNATSAFKSSASSTTTCNSLQVGTARPKMSALERVHLDYTLEALKVLTQARDYIPYDIAKHPHGLPVLFALLELPVDCAGFQSLSGLLATAFGSQDFVNEVARNHQSIMWQFLKALCTIPGNNAGSQLWVAAEALAAIPEGLEALLEAGAIVRLLGTLMAVKGYVNNYHSRLGAISLLSKFLWNPVKGAEASGALRRFLPEPVVLLLRSKAGNASLQVLDTVCENPELIWTAEMQNELRGAILELHGSDVEHSFDKVPQYGYDYAVRYQQLSNEIYIGNVYIRIYLKQPTFRLSNPVFFLEKLIEFWESSFNVQVPKTAGGFTGGSESSSDCRQVILGKEDFLSLLTSCMICVLKGEPTVIEHLLSWGFVHLLCDLLKRSISMNRRGSPMLSIVRLLHTLVGRTEVVENLAGAKVDVIQQLTIAILEDNSSSEVSYRKIAKDATIIVELLKRIFQSTYCRMLPHFVECAKQAKLTNLLLDHVLDPPAKAIEGVINPSALKIYSVDVIKAIIAASDEESAAVLQALLDFHPAWREYKDQSHDLFLTVSSKLFCCQL